MEMFAQLHAASSPVAVRQPPRSGAPGNRKHARAETRGPCAPPLGEDGVAEAGGATLHGAQGEADRVKEGVKKQRR